MSIPGAIRIQDLAGRNLGTQIRSYDERDAILYALAVGATSAELDLVYERQLVVLPTFALPLGLWAVRAAGGLGAYDPARTLHVGQKLRIRAPLPAMGEVETAASIDSVWDKGSAAIVDITVRSEFFDAIYTIFIPAAGGFGGRRGEREVAGTPPTPPDRRIGIQTTENQAALYRLTGDLHPIHIDPAAAAAAGFRRPILHGLCTLGAISLAMSRALGQHQSALQELQARLTSPVYPGSHINIDEWDTGSSLTFSASDESAAVVASGSARLRPS